MKNKIKYLFLLLAMTFTLTGCVKYNATMDIKKDKSMEFKMIYAVNQSLIGDQELLTQEDKKKLEDKGYTIEDYVKDNMSGFIISTKIKNIDMISSTNDAEYSLSAILDEDSKDKYLFKVKKGLLKNTYTANLKFDANDSSLSSENDTQLDLDDSIFDDANGDSGFSMDPGIDYSQMMSGLDLSFAVNLPYSAKSSNATEKNNDNKELKWKLTTENVESLQFEFELYNLTTIYIGAGLIIALAIGIIVVVMKRKKGNNNQPTAPNDGTLNQMNNNQPASVVQPMTNEAEQINMNQMPMNNMTQPSNDVNQQLINNPQPINNVQQSPDIPNTTPLEQQFAMPTPSTPQVNQQPSVQPVNNNSANDMLKMYNQQNGQ